MIPWELLGEAVVPGGGRLSLNRRGAEYSIRSDGHELMNSRQHASEDELARLACDRVNGRPQPPTVLIGGLGMGFTLRATLEHLPAESTVVVAEVVPALVEWNRGPLAHLNGQSLQDPRVTVRAIDVAERIRGAENEYDAVILDVDNGPEAILIASNGWLYSARGLIAARTALRANGVLAIWSAGPSPRFVDLLRRERFTVEEHRPRARRIKGPRHCVWIATR